MATRDFVIDQGSGTPPWWSGFRFSQWSTDNIWDFLCPVIVCLAVVALSVLI